MAVGLSSILGSTSYLDTEKFSIGTKGAATVVLDGSVGAIRLSSNTGTSTSTISSYVDGLVFTGSGVVQFNTSRINIINPGASPTAVLNIDLQVATVSGLTALGISSLGDVLRMTSKRSAKYDINTFDNSISLLKQLNPVIYKWRSNALESDLVKFLKDNDPRYGFILEDVEAVSSHLISYHYEGPKGLSDDQMFSDPTNFTPSMFDANGILSIVAGALKESVARIESLEDTVLSMSSRIDSLEQLVGG